MGSQDQDQDSNRSRAPEAVEYEPWPRDGCTLEEALRRTADRDAWAAATGDGRARGPVVRAFFDQIINERLITTGCFQTPSAEPSVIRARAWKLMRVLKWDMSLAMEQTPEKSRWYDVRVYPRLLAPNAVDLLAGQPLSEAFRLFVLGDPEVVALRAPALKAAPSFEQVFIRGCCYVHGAEEWPLAFEGHEITGATRLPGESTWADLFAPREPPAVIAAAEALAHRYGCLIGLLRRGELEAIGLPVGKGQPERLLRSIWSHRDFYMTAEGDVFEENPDSRDRYDRFIKRWSALTLERPSGATAWPTATSSITTHGEESRDISNIGRGSAEKPARRRPVADAVAEALESHGLERRPSNRSLKDIAATIALQMPHTPQTQQEHDALTKAVQRYYAAKTD